MSYLLSYCELLCGVVDEGNDMVIKTSCMLLHMAHFTNMEYTFDPGMNEYSYDQLNVRWNYLSIPKLQRLHRQIRGMDK